jgi:hypothetical protein
MQVNEQERWGCHLSVLTCEHDEIIIDWTLHHLLDLTDIRLALVNDTEACLMHNRV